MSDIDKLTEMVEGYPEQISQMGDSITELTAIAADLQEQREAVENVVLSAETSGSNIYLNQKAIDLGVAECDGTCSVCTSGDYGVSNITEWAIVSGGCPPSSHIVVWDSSSVTVSGGTVEDQAQYQRQVDFNNAYDHIHHPVDETGTYGLKGNRDNVLIGKGIVEINKAKIEQVLEIYEKFT
jgi:hypothetical protein